MEAGATSDDGCLCYRRVLHDADERCRSELRAPGRRGWRSLVRSESRWNHRVLGRRRRGPGHCPERHLHRGSRRPLPLLGLRPTALSCWGSNTYGQAIPPSGMFTQLAAGVFHSCGVRTDDTVACWGGTGQVQVTPPSGTFTEVATGRRHNCGIRKRGALACRVTTPTAGQPPRAAPSPRSPPAPTIPAPSETDCTLACGATAPGPGRSAGRNLQPRQPPAEPTRALWRDRRRPSPAGAPTSTVSHPPQRQITEVTAGCAHSCGLKTDGTARLLGRQRQRPAREPPVLHQCRTSRRHRYSPTRTPSPPARLLPALQPDSRSLAVSCRRASSWARTDELTGTPTAAGTYTGTDQPPATGSSPRGRHSGLRDRDCQGDHTRTPPTPPSVRRSAPGPRDQGDRIAGATAPRRGARLPSGCTAPATRASAAAPRSSPTPRQ